VTLPKTADAGARRTAANALLSAVAQVLGKVATLAWTLVAARRLTVADFGRFTFFLAVALLLSSIAEWGFDAAMVGRASARPERTGFLFGQSLACELLVGLPVFAVVGGLVVASRPGSEVRLAGVLVLLAVLLDVVSDSCRGVAATLLRQGGAAAALIAQRVLTAVLIIVVLLAGGGLVGLAAALLLGSAIGLALHVLLAVRRLGVSLDLSGVRPAGLRNYARGTAMLGISTLVLMALFRGDIVLLGALRGDAEVASYSVAYRLLETVLFVVFALRSAVFPVMSRATHPDEVARSLEGVAAAAALLYIPFAVVLIVDAPAVLHLLFGPQYARSASGALRWLAAAPLAYGLAYMGNAALQATDRTRGMLLGAVAAVVLNLVGDLLLIPHYGADAAAAMTTAAYALEAVVVLRYLRPQVRPRLLRAHLLAVAAAVPLLLVLLVSSAPVVVEVPLGALAFAVSWLLLARRLEPAQLTLVRQLVRR